MISMTKRRQYLSLDLQRIIDTYLFDSLQGTIFTPSYYIIYLFSSWFECFFFHLVWFNAYKGRLQLEKTFDFIRNNLMELKRDMSRRVAMHASFHSYEYIVCLVQHNADTQNHFFAVFITKMRKTQGKVVSE